MSVSFVKTCKKKINVFLVNKTKLLAYNYWRQKEGYNIRKNEISRPLHQKAKILWQLENLQNYKDLYGKPLECDWRAKRLLLIQILLISNAHKNSPFKDINLKICM